MQGIFLNMSPLDYHSIPVHEIDDITERLEELNDLKPKLLFHNKT